MMESIVAWMSAAFSAVEAAVVVVVVVVVVMAIRAQEAKSVEERATVALLETLESQAMGMEDERSRVAAAVVAAAEQTVAAVAVQIEDVEPKDKGDDALAKRTPVERRSERFARIQLPPARVHVAASREPVVTCPFPMLDGNAAFYSQDDFDLPGLLRQVAGFFLSLGVAPPQNGGLLRAGEEFAAVCGFSAALGPLLMEHTLDAVFGRKLFTTVESLPIIHVTYMFSVYWEKEVAPFDAAERFHRVLKNPHSGAIGKAELRPFVQAIVDRHPCLVAMTPDERLCYVDTVLAVLFYQHSRCGVINLRDLRASGFVPCLNAVGRLESNLEDAPYFTLAGYYQVRGDYINLGGGVGSLPHQALVNYRPGGGVAIGAVRAQRLLDVGRWPRQIKSPDGDVVSACGKKESDYDAFVDLFLHEMALRYGPWSERDIRYCFSLVDATGEGRIGRLEVTPFLDEMKNSRVEGRLSPDSIPQPSDFIAQYLDALVGGVHDVEYIKLKDMLKPGHIGLAGQFFQDLFLGFD